MGAGPEEQAADKEKESSMEQWTQLTMQRLSNQLARQPSAMERRACLRTWQRTYHPDKNPGRADEVLPIFRWVQACWDRDFKATEMGELNPKAESKASSRAAAAASDEGPSNAGSSGGSAVPSRPSLVAPARRRIKGK